MHWLHTSHAYQLNDSRWSQASVVTVECSQTLGVTSTERLRKRLLCAQLALQ